MRARTADLRITNASLYQLSYIGKNACAKIRCAFQNCFSESMKIASGFDVAQFEREFFQSALNGFSQGVGELEPQVQQKLM
jgi:hypothetical protein